jgi:hypothetical protein
MSRIFHCMSPRAWVPPLSVGGSNWASTRTIKEEIFMFRRLGGCVEFRLEVSSGRRRVLQKLVVVKLVKKFSDSFWSQKVRYRLQICPSPVYILGQIRILSFCLIKINFNIIFPSVPSYFKWYLGFSFSDQYFVRVFRV